MIESHFDGSRTGLVTGAYQYDSGQRLIMHGLPSPDELVEMDELLSGELATVQAQFSYVGDSQAENCLAQWDEWRGAWIATIPDAYLTRHEDVTVHVNVYYGADENGSRSKTMYEAVFRPISRPAPNDVVTDEQLAEWADLETEITLALASTESAAQSATENGALAAASAEEAQTATEAAKNAQAAAETATEGMNEVEQKLLQASATDLPAGSAPTAALTDSGWVFGIPQGAKGETGDAGADGPSDIDITFADGALTITPKEG